MAVIKQENWLLFRVKRCTTYSNLIILAVRVRVPTTRIFYFHHKSYQINLKNYDAPSMPSFFSKIHKISNDYFVPEINCSSFHLLLFLALRFFRHPVPDCIIQCLGFLPLFGR